LQTERVRAEEREKKTVNFCSFFDISIKSFSLALSDDVHHPNSF